MSIIKQYLADLMTINERDIGFYQFILDNGKHYENGDFDFDKSANVTQKNCFNNSALYTIRTGLKYIEGYYVTESIGFPFEHAWNAGDNAEAFDVTSLKFNIPVKERFGVEIPEDILKEYLVSDEQENPFITALGYYYKKTVKS